MKVKFRKDGVFGKTYSVVKPCCDFTEYFTTVHWKEDLGFYIKVPYSIVRCNYCGVCGEKTEVVEDAPQEAYENNKNAQPESPQWNV